MAAAAAAGAGAGADAKSWSTSEYLATNKHQLELIVSLFSATKKHKSNHFREFRIELQVHGDCIHLRQFVWFPSHEELSLLAPEGAKRQKLDHWPSSCLMVEAFLGQFRSAHFNGVHGQYVTAIHVGAWYEVYGNEMRPVGRNELCFDIDMNAYSDVRTCGCGQKKGLCSKCVWLLHGSIQILVHGLREHFGFEHILCTFSGNRGAHIRVFDERAVCLSDKARSALMQFFMPDGEKRPPRIVRTDRLTSYESVDVSLCMPYFMRVWDSVADTKNAFQAFLMSHATSDHKGHVALVAKQVETVLNDFVGVLSQFDAFKTSMLQWSGMGGTVKGLFPCFRRCGLIRELKHADHASTRAWTAVRFRFEAWLLACFMPRLDVEVTPRLCHQMRMPFTLHPKKQRAVLPFDPAHAADLSSHPTPAASAMRITQTLLDSLCGVSPEELF